MTVSDFKITTFNAKHKLSPLIPLNWFYYKQKKGYKFHSLATISIFLVHGMDTQGKFAHNNICVSINSIASKCKNSGLSYHKILQAKSANSKQQSHPPLLCFWWAETCRPPYFCWHYNNSYYIKSSKFHTHRHRLGPRAHTCLFNTKLTFIY